MTNERAAEILREISRQNLPTVNGIPFVEIRQALSMGADALAPITIGEVADDLYKRLTRGGSS